MSATLNNTANTDNTDNGLSFEVREIEYEDDYASSIHPGGIAHRFSQNVVAELEESDDSPQPDSPISPFPLVRSSSSTATSSKPTFQCSPAMATADGMYAPPPSSTSDVSTPAIRTHPNVKRLVFGENPETIATLKFLESQRIDTTSLVTKHIMKYGSRARIAHTNDGQVVGFAMFDNEIDQEQLQDQAQHMSADELAKIVQAKPFIFLQLLMIDPGFVTSTAIGNEGAEWKKELVAQFCDCVTKNGKVAIARTESENQSEIEFYRSCGFFTMHDMGIPSYPSSKGTDISVLAYTPLGKEGTAEIFRKFYAMGGRY
jgi:hypothetical protein